MAQHVFAVGRPENYRGALVGSARQLSTSLAVLRPRAGRLNVASARVLCHVLEVATERGGQIGGVAEEHVDGGGRSVGVGVFRAIEFGQFLGAAHVSRFAIVEAVALRQQSGECVDI